LTLSRCGATIIRLPGLLEPVGTLLSLSRHMDVHPSTRAGIRSLRVPASDIDIAHGDRTRSAGAFRY